MRLVLLRNRSLLFLVFLLLCLAKLCVVLLLGRPFLWICFLILQIRIVVFRRLCHLLGILLLFLFCLSFLFLLGFLLLFLFQISFGRFRRLFGLLLLSIQIMHLLLMLQLREVLQKLYIRCLLRIFLQRVAWCILFLLLIFLFLDVCQLVFLFRRLLLLLCFLVLLLHGYFYSILLMLRLQHCLQFHILDDVGLLLIRFLCTYLVFFLLLLVLLVLEFGLHYTHDWIFPWLSSFDFSHFYFFFLMNLMIH